MEIRTFRREDTEAVVRLWEECELTRPWNNPRLDIERKMNEQPELFFVGIVAGKVIASAMAGFDGHRGWVYYLSVSPDCRQRGFGKQMMEHVEKCLLEKGCPKINLQVRNSNMNAVEFYRSIGYVEDQVVSFGKRLIPD